MSLFDVFKTSTHKLNKELIKASLMGDLKSVRKMFEKGADLNVLYKHDKRDFTFTPLMGASGQGHINVVSFLLENDINANETNNHQRTALHFAAERGHLDVVIVLLEYGADPNIEDLKGINPMLLAGGNNHMKLMELLFKHMDIKK